MGNPADQYESMCAELSSILGFDGAWSRDSDCDGMYLVGVVAKDIDELKSSLERCRLMLGAFDGPSEWKLSLVPRVAAEQLGPHVAASGCLRATRGGVGLIAFQVEDGQHNVCSLNGTVGVVGKLDDAARAVVAAVRVLEMLKARKDVP